MDEELPDRRRTDAEAEVLEEGLVAVRQRQERMENVIDPLQVVLVGMSG